MWTGIDIPPGIVRGASPQDSPGRWYDCNLVRWQNGVLEPIGGWLLETATPLSDRIRVIKRWRDNTKLLRTLVFTDTEVRTYDPTTSTYVDVSPVSLAAMTSAGAGLVVGYGVGGFGEESYGDARSVGSELLTAVVPMWSAAQWGEDILAVSSADGRLLLHDNTSPTSAMSVVGGTAPTGNRAVFVTDERHCVLLQPGGVPRRVGWSDREDYTDFDYTSLVNTAGYLDLECRTPLFCQEKVREGDLLFTETEVFHMRFIGLPFVYSINNLEETQIIGPRASASGNGAAFWWAKDGFYVSDGQQVRPLPCPVWAYIEGELNMTVASSQIHAVWHGALPEIWWWYPSGSNIVPDKYVIFNYVENWWAIGELAREAAAPALSSKGPLMADNSHDLFEHERGFTNSGTTRSGTVFVESSSINVPPVGGMNMEITQAMIASPSAYTTFQLYMYTRQTQQGDERTFGPYPTKSDGYIDTRVTGRDVRIRVDAIADTDWAFGQIRLDVAEGSKR